MNQKHVPFGAGIERPVDNLKFTAYKNILIDGEVNGEFKTAYEKAVQLIIDKKPVLGEPVVVPIKYKHTDGVETVELVFGIGSADPAHPYIACSVDNNIGDEIKISDSDSSTGFVTLKEKLESIIDNATENVIDVIINDPNYLTLLVDAIMKNSTTVQEAISAQVEEHLRWKSLTELIPTI